uniref:G_PROTEIN_RECEP_F1_2 domain-containing protein n=1 Tax=Steinernema glaseri TaxID=37863 RepID=A0A1I7ZHI0_9BILA
MMSLCWTPSFPCTDLFQPRPVHRCQGSTMPMSSSTVAPLNVTEMPREVCENSHVISVEAIISFCKFSDSALFVLTIISSILQVFVMCQAVHNIRRRSSDKCMHVFLLSMTFADFILTAVGYPIELLPRVGVIPKVPYYVSVTMHMLCWMGLSISSFSLVLLNVDKLFYFRFPLRYSTYFTRFRAICVVSLCWAGCALFVIFAWITKSFNCVDEDCATLAIFPNKMHIYLTFMIVVGVIPTLTSLAVALYLLKVVTAHRKQMAEERALCQDTTGRRQSTQFTTRLRTFYFIFMTTIFTAMTLLPYRIVSLQRAVNPSQSHTCLSILFFWILMYMIYLNSIFNPLITVTVLPQYRCRLINMIFFGKAKKEEDKTFRSTEL